MSKVFFDRHQQAVISKGFWLAGIYNILGILVFSQAFTNHMLESLYPEVFSTLGLIAIILWGMAYCAVAKSWANVPALVLVFCLEKLVYGATWIWWHMENWGKLGEIFTMSPHTATFFLVYGAGDFGFAIFFFWVGWRSLQHARA